MIKKLLLYIFVAILLGCLPLLYKYGCIIFFSDFSMQQIPFIIETKRMLLSGTPFWTWNNYFGDNFIGSFSFYTLTSPFVWLNCLVPDKYMLYGITFTYFLKFMCCGLVAYAYFRKIHFSKELSMIGALLYSLSSFAILNMMYYHFMEPMICFPILLIAIENYVEGGKYRMSFLVASSFLVAFVNFYFIPCSLFAGGIYLLCRVFGGNYVDKLKKVIAVFALMGLGILMASFILFPVIMYMHGAPRVEMRFSVNILGILERLRVLFVPRFVEGDNFLFVPGYMRIGNSNLIALPIVGCFFVYLYLKINRDWVFWLVVISLFLYLSPFNGVFSMFTNSEYTRWGYALTIFLVLPTLKILDEDLYNITEYKRYIVMVIILVAGVYIYCFIFKYYYCEIKISVRDLIFSAYEYVFMLIHAFLMFFYVKRRKQNILCMYIVFVSSIQFSFMYCSRNGGLKSFINHKDKSVCLLVKYVLNNDYCDGNNIFLYRHDFIGSERKNASGNVGLYNNIPSVCTYNSCKNNATRSLMFVVDSTSLYSNWFYPCQNRTSFDALMSVKTVVDYKDPYPDTVRVEGLAMVKSTDNYDVYACKHYIPMGFTYDSYVCDEVLEDSLVKDAPLQMLANVCVKKEDVPQFARYLKTGCVNNGYSLDSICGERRKHTCDWVKADTHGFSALAKMDKDNFVFFSVPADPGFKAYVDKNEAKIYNVNLGMSAIFVPKGKHNIRFDYFPPGLKEGSWVTSFALVLLFFLFVYERIQNRRESTYID